MTIYRSRKWYPHYDDDSTVGAGDPPADPPADPPVVPPAEEKKFSQKDLDHHIDKRFKKERTEKEQLIRQLEAIKTSGLTPEAKQELEEQITRLQESMQTKEQTLQQKMTELEKKHSKTVETLTGDVETWKGRYHKSMIERAILDGANAFEAEDPSQFVMMFGPAARLEEEVDNMGKGTGVFVPKMKFQGIDPESKKPVTLDLPVGEAIAHMREQGLHKNLFKHGAVSGTWKPGTGSANGKNEHAMPERKNYGSEEDYSKAYHEWRDSHEPDGTPISQK